MCVSESHLRKTHSCIHICLCSPTGLLWPQSSLDLVLLRPGPVMAGPGVALRLHEFRESEGAETLRARWARQLLITYLSIDVSCHYELNLLQHANSVLPVGPLVQAGTLRDYTRGSWVESTLSTQRTVGKSQHQRPREYPRWSSPVVKNKNK